LTSKINYLMATSEYWDEILAFFAGWAQKTNELSGKTGIERA